MTVIGSDRAPAATFEVVFVCTGNRARSPLAAEVLAAAVRELPVTVRSFGTQQLPSESALPFAVAVAADRGLDLRGHRSRPLEPGQLRDADLVIGFERFHVASAVIDGGAARERTFLVREAVALLDAGALDDVAESSLPARVDALHRFRADGAARSALEVPDPAGGPLEAFEALAVEIDDLVHGLVVDLLGVHSYEVGGT